MTASASSLDIDRVPPAPDEGIPAQRALLWAAAVYLVIIVSVALLAPLLAPTAPDAIDLSAGFQGASRKHLLGTDRLGRDILSRLMYGARLSLVGPLGILTIAGIIGAVVGVVAAWTGGWIDSAISRATDALFAFPGLLFAVFVIAIVGRGLAAAVIALGLAYFPVIAKLTRSAALSERERAYIEAYRVQGFSGLTIAIRFLLPNVVSVVLGYIVVLFGSALLSLASLSFLGFGAQPPQSDWGLMVSEGQLALIQGHPLPALAPAVCIGLTVLAVNIIGVRISDRLGRSDR